MEESIKIEEAIAKALKLEAVDPRTYSPLVLAYIGDAVYELLIRTKVINHGSMQVNKMHKKSASQPGQGRDPGQHHQGHSG